MRPTKVELENLAWRSVWTFIQSFTGGLLVASFIEVEVVTVAAIAGAGAVLSVVKNFASTKLGKQTA